MYFDTHAHYFDDRFASELPISVERLLSELFSSEVSGVIQAGTTPSTTREALRMAERFPNMYVAAGLHPTDSQGVELDPALSEIEAILKEQNPRIVAVGEIGLDYHYDDTDKERQDEAFFRQMQLAERYGLPVVIHDRDAHADVLAMLRRFPRVRGVLHSYSGSAEMAAELVEMGYMISFSGSLTYGKKPRRVAQTVPTEHLLIETDAPYLPPSPLRGTVNHSGNLVYTCAALAEQKGVSPAEMARITEENARRFFGIG